MYRPIYSKYIQNINANILKFKEIIQLNSVWIDMKLLNYHVPFYWTDIRPPRCPFVVGYLTVRAGGGGGAHYPNYLVTDLTK